MWRRLEVEDYDAVMSLRQAVLSSLPDPDFYVREDDEHMFVRGHLDVFGESVGYFDRDDLVAYLALTTDLVPSGEDIEFAACAPTFNDVVFAAAMVILSITGVHCIARASAATSPSPRHSERIAVWRRSRRATTARFGRTSPKAFDAHGRSTIPTVVGACCSSVTSSVAPQPH